ncbi:hypothetical protein [Providencia heimbachae]|uniref:hypothetical protein n=1 Tax=Providencia heimbachae TaxID=333962 RepID=UPI002240A160|nr:hypothetical protein [Providencia heimbachae]
MKKSTLIKAEFAVSLIFLSNISFSSGLNDNETYVPEYTDFILECSDYIVGDKYPNNTTKQNVMTYLKYHQVSSTSLPQITESLMKLKRSLPKLNLPDFLNGHDREYAITFCAVVTHEKIK